MKVVAGYIDVSSERNRSCSKRRGFLRTSVRETTAQLPAVALHPSSAGRKQCRAGLPHEPENRLSVLCAHAAAEGLLKVLSMRVSEASRLAGAEIVPWLC